MKGGMKQDFLQTTDDGTRFGLGPSSAIIFHFLFPPTL